MALKPSTVAVLLLLLAVNSHAGQAAPEQAPEHAPAPATAGEDVASENADVARVLHMMQDGDGKALFDLYQSAHDPVVHVWSAMAIERTRFNLEAATADAKLCEEKLLETHPTIALMCAQFQAGNLRLGGHWQAAHDLEADLVRRYKDRNAGKRFAALQKNVEREAAIAQTAIEMPAADVKIPIQTDSLQPKFEATGNGHDFKLMLDTGATDLVLGDDTARDLGVKLIDQTGHTSGFLSKNVPVQRGILDTLKVGALVWHNVPVRIVPHRLALLGGNLIAPFGTIRVTRKAVEISTAASPTPACEDSMIAGTDLTGHNLRVLPLFLVGDVPQSVLLDTGSSHFLLGTKAALDEVTRLSRRTVSINDIGGSHPFSSAESAKIKMQIGNQPFNIYFTVLTDSDMKHAITLGADALRDMDFLLDFRHQHLCFPMHDNLH